MTTIKPDCRRAKTIAGVGLFYGEATGSPPGLEFGVTLAVACWVLPFDPDDLAPVGVVIQSNPGSE